MTGQTKVVVGAEVQDLAAGASHTHAGVLLSSDHPLCLPSARLQFAQIENRDRFRKFIVKLGVISLLLLTFVRFINLRENPEIEFVLC